MNAVVPWGRAWQYNEMECIEPIAIIHGTNNSALLFSSIDTYALLSRTYRLSHLTLMYVFRL